MSAGDALQGVGAYAAAAFAGHAGKCARCRQVELERPASLAGACLEGSRLAKEAAAHEAAEARRRARRSS